MSMKFVFPTLEYKEKAIDYINEFYEYNSEINGSGSLDRFLRESTYEAWLQKLIGAIDIANIPQGKVPGLTCFNSCELKLLRRDAHAKAVVKCR